MTLDLFTSCTGCGVDLVGGPGLCVPCAADANGGLLPCSTCNGDRCDVCAFSGEADSVGWDYTTWPEGERPRLREGLVLAEWIEDRTGKKIDRPEVRR